MEIEEKVRKKFKTLIKKGDQLKHGNENNHVCSIEHQQECTGWLASTHNLVHLVLKSPSNPYRVSIDQICTRRGFNSNQFVGTANVILKSLLKDIDLGLLSSIENQTKASVFDDFLDHAKEYLRRKHKNEAGVIAGVVFEDTLRNIYRKMIDSAEKGKTLETLIVDLVHEEILTQTKAKRARVAAHVRTKATHAQWDEFDLKDVDTTIDFTEELILKYLEY
ncbi:hypothetical protein [Methylobacter tundripaludum]|uniref:DUF4145 domain-containing protein n=1 Tax=Methylobacter tundripaludum (strain ATCC BAA-1195 / DSM 17260 / SV96) TaxID=697282 RepID=G3ITL9_METTV|nr:hypothetical protein [Methylobacter tundripaludum]EGW21429.1 hypothetical protein Mettu_0188 [Methylobacter tundripaludum SV96]